MLNTKLITESNEAYHSRKSVSASMIKTLRKSPRVYQAEIVDRRIERKESAAMRLGTAVHSRILEPELFYNDYAICPSDIGDRRTKAYKAWAATCTFKEVLTADEDEKINAIANAVTSHPIASRIVGRPDYVEKSFEYDDAETGARCRVRFDGVKGGVVFDIKTISECTPKQIERDAADYGYHIQAAHYLAGLEAIAPDTPWVFMFIFVETSEPFRCRVFQPDESWLNEGRALRSFYLRDLQRRMETGDWSEVNESNVNVLYLPSYYKSEV